MTRQPVTQRWRSKRDRYRPAGEVIDTLAHSVAPIPGSVAKSFVLEHHYSSTFPVARFRFGLFHRNSMVGVAVFSHPANDAVLTNLFPGDAIESTELGRFVLLDSVPGNGETWFLARCFEHLRAEGLLGVVSFSDPVPRSRADGSVVFPGHLGTIYQAFNGRYTGRGAAATLRLLPDGTVFSNRAQGKIARMERGWRYTAAQLERYGAAPLDPARENPREWLRRWRSQLTRALRHPGNHRYAWALHRAVRKHLPDALPFPKQLEAA